MMLKKHKRIIWLTLLIGAAVLITLRSISSGRSGASTATGKKPSNTQTAKAGNANRGNYVRRSQLSPLLRWNLNALGDRLEKPGKERLTLTGTLLRMGDSQPVPFVAVLQFPDHLHLTTQVGFQNRVLSFDGNAARTNGGSPDSRELDLIESTVFDTAEHFFSEQTLGMATRFLGDHFRPDDGSQPNYRGPYYSVYQTAGQVKLTVPARQQSKLYWFNSDNQLLERGTYQIEGSGT